MVAVGAEVGGSWLPTSGVVGFFIALLLLSIFLTALCSQCKRRSFELRDSEANKDPSALIKVVKLEEAIEVRENPMINESLKDETDLNPSKGATVYFTPWRSHLGALQNHHDVNSSTAPDNIYHTIGGEGSSTDANVSSMLTNHRPGEEPGVCSAAMGDSIDVNSEYTRVIMKERPVHEGETLQEVLAKEEVSFPPPPPDRRTQLEG